MRILPSLPPRCLSRASLSPADGTVKTLSVVATCSSGGGGQISAGGVFAQGFLEAAGGKKVLIVNKGNTAQSITFVGATGGSWTYIDESTAYGPAATIAVPADTWTIAPYGLGILRLP